MNRKRIFLVALLFIAFGIAYYFYGGSSTPKGQPPLVRFPSGDLAPLKRVQQLSYSRACNALTDLSLLFAGGLCNRTIAAGNQ